MVSKVRFLGIFLCVFLCVFLATNNATAQWANWKISSESPNADSASNMTLATLRAIVIAGTGTGSVTSVSTTVPTGLAVTVTNSTTTPVVAISNNLAAGFVSSAGVGGSLTSSATIAGTAITGNISGNAGNVSGTVAVGNGGSGATNLSGLLKGNGVSAFTGAVAGTDYLAPYTSQTANQIFAAPNGSAGTPSFRAIVASDIPLLNQSTGGNAATATLASTVTTNANLTGSVVTSVGNATSITAASIANSMLANPTTSVNGVTLILGGTQAAAFTLQNVTTAGNSTNVASTYSGGLTASGGLTSTGTTAISATLVEAPSTTVTTSGVTTTATIGTSSAQMPLNIGVNSTLTLTAGAASGTLMDCKMIPTSTYQAIFTSSASETFNGNPTFTVLAGSQNTTVKFYKYSATAWTVSVTQ